MASSDSLARRVAGKKTALIGAGISNTPLIDFLLRLGSSVTVHDKKNAGELSGLSEAFKDKDVSFRLGEKYLDDINADIIFRSPGIRPDTPEILKAVGKGAYLTSEMQEFFELCPAKIFAVTGSDGKTTTTTIISKLLEAACAKRGGRVFLGGNIGMPLLPRVDDITENDFAVVELSSFQLQTMTKSPDVAVITNITPNHLNWHTDMAEYVNAKLNIVRYMKKSGVVVLNYENEYTREAPRSAHTDTDCVFFSSKRVLDSGVYEEDGYICSSGHRIMKSEDILIPGRHNVENYIAAIAACEGYADDADIYNVAASFGGVEHRNELVRVFEGVSYYNSSIDSSPTRTIAAINSYKKKLIVLCGGQDKHLDYTPLAAPLCARARAVIMTGMTAGKIRSAVSECPDYKEGNPALYDVSDYGEAVDLARSVASPGDIVLMSPASTSFDCFKNFEERGRYFKNKVNSLV